MRIAIVIPFQDEAEHLGRLLASLERQVRRPERLLLVDDGSRDSSPAIAEQFAATYDWATVLRRPRRPRDPDRLSLAAEYLAFQWAVKEAGEFDAVGKLDADLELPADFVATLERELEQDPRLGIVGAFLSIRDRLGRRYRERHPDYHVRGATKFYRLPCYKQLQALDPILGWDTIDEATARMHGWTTRSVSIPSGDPLHLRPTGTMDGLIRGYSRWGACAYAAGYHPAWVLLGALRRVKERPPLIGAVAYLLGWLRARWRRLPGAPPEVRRYVRSEQLGRLRARLARRGGC